MSAHERVALMLLGLLAVLGLGLSSWRQRRALTMTQTAIATSQGAAWDRALVIERQLDVNTATVAELERLPGVGSTLARRIVEERSIGGPFLTVDDLQRVHGLGPTARQAIRPFIVTPAARSSKPTSDATRGMDAQQRP